MAAGKLRLCELQGELHHRDGSPGRSLRPSIIQQLRAAKLAAEQCCSQKIHKKFTKNILIFLKKYDIIYIEKKFF
jgi:hypothetical protein